MIQTNSVNMGDLTGSLGDGQLTNGYKGAVNASPASDSGSSEVVFGRKSLTSQTVPGRGIYSCNVILIPELTFWHLSPHYTKC